MNAIISARRSDMIDATLYLVGKDYETGELVKDATPCSMCRRLIINAGISRVIIRNTKDRYTVVNVRDWVFEDDSLRYHKLAVSYTHLFVLLLFMV